MSWCRVLAVLCAVSVLACPAFAAPIVGAPPVEVFAAPPLLEGPKLSPDGTRLVAKMLVHGEQMLVVHSLVTGGTPLHADIGHDNELNSWRWVNNDWLVLSIGRKDVVYGFDVYVTRLIGMKADMSKAVAIDWEKSGIAADGLLWVAHDGTPRIVFQKETGIETAADFNPSVFEADVSTGKTHRLFMGRDAITEWYADGNGKVRLGTGWDDRKWTLLYRDGVSDKFAAIPNSFTAEHGPPIPLVYRADGSAITIDDNSGFDSVLALALPSFKLGERLFSVPGYDVDSVVLNQARDGLVGAYYTDKGDKTEWFTPDLRDLQGGLDKTLGAGNARIVSLSRDETRMLVEVGSAAQAGGYYYWDTADAAMHLIGFNNPVLKNQLLSPVKSLRFTARDGKSIEAILTLPRGVDPKNLPLIVMPHGGPYARDSEQYDWWVQYLGAQGYAVVQPNYRGSTGYGADFRTLGEGQWGTGMQDDLLDAVKWLAGEGIADPKRVCIVGASYGGYAAMRGAQRDGATYRCAVSFAGVSDLSGMMRYDRKFLQNVKSSNSYWKKQAPDFTAVSPRFHAAEFSVPILLVHGDKDKRVPVGQSKALAEQLKLAGKPYQFIEQPLADHHFSREADRLEFLKAMKAFLDRYNPS